jgi:hypothetical protein
VRPTFGNRRINAEMLGSRQKSGTGNSKMRHRLRLELPTDTKLAEAMALIRRWLDDHGADAAEFAANRTQTGALSIKIVFGNSEVAHEFRRAFPALLNRRSGLLDYQLTPR